MKTSGYEAGVEVLESRQLLSAAAPVMTPFHETIASSALSADKPVAAPHQAAVAGSWQSRHFFLNDAASQDAATDETVEPASWHSARQHYGQPTQNVNVRTISDPINGQALYLLQLSDGWTAIGEQGGILVLVAPGLVSFPAFPTSQPPQSNAQPPTTIRPTSVDRSTGSESVNAAVSAPIAPLSATPAMLVTAGEAKTAANAELARPMIANAAVSLPALGTISLTSGLRGSAGFSSRLLGSIQMLAGGATESTGAVTVFESFANMPIASAVAAAPMAAVASVAPRIFQFAQINWASALGDAWNEMAEDGAATSLPLATVDSHVQAWIITGSVVVLDLSLLGWYASRRVKRKRLMRSAGLFMA